MKHVAAIFATGPSLNSEDALLCKHAGFLTVAVNDAYKLAPWADIHFAADDRWWDLHILNVFDSFKNSEIYTSSQGAAHKHKITFIESYSKIVGNRGISGLEISQFMEQRQRKKVIWRSGNSGHMAMALAYTMGARIFLLLGFDMRDTEKGHFFGEHPKPLRMPQRFDAWVGNFAVEKQLITDGKIKAAIFNCTPESGLCKLFPYNSVETVISWLRVLPELTRSAST